MNMKAILLNSNDSCRVNHNRKYFFYLTYRLILAVMANFAPRGRGNSPLNRSTLSVGSARKRSISSARSDRSVVERKRARERHAIDMANVS